MSDFELDGEKAKQFLKESDAPEAAAELVRAVAANKESKRAKKQQRKRKQSPSNEKVEETIRELIEFGIPELPQFRSLIPEPTGSMAARVKALPGYSEAHDSALSAMLRLFAQTTTAQVGLGKSGQPFRWELGLHLVGQGFITEAAGSPLPAVVALGQEVAGVGLSQSIQQALHNAEKLTEPKPQMLRDLNKVRSLIVRSWLDQHLWLMKDDTIADWFNRRCRGIREEGIMRNAVNRIVRELGLKKSARPVVKCINDKDQIVFNLGGK